MADKTHRMNCPNCGAAMALVESHRFFQCRYCGTSQFPQGLDSDGLLVIGHPADAPACPVCTTRMAHALVFNEPVNCCENCRGLLMPRQTFAELVTVKRRWATGPPVTPPTLDPRALDRTLACPVCHGRFHTYPYGGPGNAAIDGCTRCDLIWLDLRELHQIIDAPGRDLDVSAAPACALLPR